MKNNFFKLAPKGLTESGPAGLTVSLMEPVGSGVQSTGFSLLTCVDTNAVGTGGGICLTAMLHCQTAWRSMMPSERLSVRIDAEIRRNLSKEASRVSKSESDLVREALEAFLSKQASQPSCYDLAKN